MLFGKASPKFSLPSPRHRCPSWDFPLPFTGTGRPGSPDAYRSPHRRSWERPPLLQSAPPLLGFFSSAHRSCSPHRRSWDFAPAPTAPAVRTAAPAVHGRRTPTVMKPGSAARETGRTLPKTTTITTTPSSSAASDCEDTPSPHGPLCHLHHRGREQDLSKEEP
ncbi:uncharacterized protein LOC128194956 [Vigna angularis]|uniref:uncharacterized protein LOC128194956 n=1 Tax=Phaseolus angularis TaxID=3914 RepID=UPI0022B32EFA|nr:uncharacterized protein LOC128194956 [Vigna angularis]